MKLYVLSLLFLFSFIFFSYSQEISKNAIGLRLGDSDGFGTEISYQRALGSNNRLEVDFGWRNSNNTDGIKLTGLYQWIWILENRFNWYAGVGGGLGFYGFTDNKGRDFNETFVFVAGDIGIEYNFDIPLLLSLDIRPEIDFGNGNNDLDFDIGLGIRYQF